MAGVDVEAMVIGGLLEDPGIIALVGDRVYHTIPQQPRYPLIRVYRIGGTTDHVGHLDSAQIQFDAIDRRPDVARAVAAEVLDVMLRMICVTTAEGVLLGAQPLVGLHDEPDPVTKYPMYRFDMTVFAHPVAA